MVSISELVKIIAVLLLLIVVSVGAAVSMSIIRTGVFLQVAVIVAVAVLYYSAFRWVGRRYLRSSMHTRLSPIDVITAICAWGLIGVAFYFHETSPTFAPYFHSLIVLIALAFILVTMVRRRSQR